MAKLVSGAVTEVTPPGQDDQAEGERAVYSFRPPTVYTRAAYRAALARAGLVYHDPVALLAVMREGLEAIFEGDPGELDAHRALLERYAAELADEALTPETGRLVGELELILRRHYPAFADRMADNELFVELAPVEAFRQFVTAWRGVEVAFRAGPDGVPKELLEGLPIEHVQHVAGVILGVEQPSPSAEKNSELPSTGDGTRARSKTAKSTRRKTPRRPATPGGSSRSGSNGSTSIPATS